MARFVPQILGGMLILWMWGSLRGDEPIDKLILQLDQPLTAGRVDAAQQLARHGTDAAKATDALVRLLGDSQADMRLSAAYALGCVQTDSPHVLSALVTLLSDRDEHVRYSAQWSIAQIAKSLKSDLTTEQVNELVSSLRQATKEMRPREHQERHLIAIELALSRLEQMLPPKVVSVPAAQSAQDVEEIARARAMAESMYQATDAAGRYCFIRRLSKLDAYPDSIRRIILEKESRQPDTSLLRYAVVRWGGRAHSLLAEILQSRFESAELNDDDASLLREMTPVTAEQRQLVMKIASDRGRSYELRWVALQSLGRAPDIEPELIDEWLKVIEDEQSDIVLRCGALEALAELGMRAHAAQPRLLAMLPNAREEALFGSLAHTLVAVAPASAPVGAVLLDRLKRTSVDSPLYVDLVEACRGMGPAAAQFQAEFLRGLQHNDVYTRQKCLEAIQQIATNDSTVVTALLDRVVDSAEDVSVKSLAAEVLASLGIPGQQALAQRIGDARRSGNTAALTSLLRCVTIVGGDDAMVGQHCLEIVNSSSMDLDMRVAAATALSAVRPVSPLTIQALDGRCAEDQPEELRSAALLSLAHFNAPSLAQHIEAFSREDSILLRASAAYARHLVGESHAAFQELVALIDGSETDMVISRCLQDMGSVTEPWLLAVAADRQALPDARQICFGLACESPSVNWSKLLPLIEDAEVGNHFAMIAESIIQSDEGIEAIIDLLESGRMRPAGQSRLVDLLFPDGLGAGDGDQDWKGLTLQQPGARATLAARAASEAEAMSAAEMPSDVEPAAPAEAIRRDPVMPRIEVPIADMPIREQPQVVKVFYGTNRGRIAGNNEQRDVAVSVLATAGGGMLAMLFCLIGFIRSGHRFYAVIALVAMGMAAPFGYQAALKYTGDALRPSINYDGSYRKEVELGVCNVSIPPGHRAGEIESPQMLQLQFKQELNKHVVLTQVTPLGKPAFFGDLHQTLTTQGKNILVFVHGYNVSFEDAARRTAQMSFDLKFAGAPVFYSWPSQANWYGYPTDRQNIEHSVTQIKQFLLDLAHESGAETINLVAHSMGNVGLTEALKEIEQTSAEPLFNQVVLAAPDIDAVVFKERIAPAITGKAKHVTLYTSQTDLALIASRYFNNGKRVGDSTDGVPLFDKIETIDATSIDSSLIGHSYYGSNVTVLTDLANVLMNRPASSREYLQTILSTPQPYWTFSPTQLSKANDTTTTR